MNWKPLTSVDQLDTVDAASQAKPILLFKHSTTCNISRTALDRLERAWTEEDDAKYTAYFLDLKSHREVSNAIADRYGIAHESPQSLVISGGKCIESRSHFSITYAEVKDALGA